MPCLKTAQGRESSIASSTSGKNADVLSRVALTCVIPWRPSGAESQLWKPRSILSVHAINQGIDIPRSSKKYNNSDRAQQDVEYNIVQPAVARRRRHAATTHPSPPKAQRVSVPGSGTLAFTP